MCLLYNCVCMYEQVCVYASVHSMTWIWRSHDNLAGVRSLLPPFEFWGLKSGGQARQQAPLFTQSPPFPSAYCSLRTGNFHTAKIYFHQRLFFFFSWFHLCPSTPLPPFSFHNLVNHRTSCDFLKSIVNGRQKTVLQLTFISIDHSCQ